MQRNRIVRAGAWVIFAYAAAQCIRLLSSLILTRLLEPSVFGIMALVFSIMAGFNMFTDVGLHSFIVRHKRGLKKQVLNCVWKIQVIRGWLILIISTLSAGCIFLLQDFTSYEKTNVFGNSELPLILILVSVASLIGSYQSMAKSILVKKMISGPMEIIELATQAFIAIITITLAYFYRNIWAIVMGLLIANVFKLFLINSIFKFRHKFEWDKKTYSEVISFGKWIFFASVITFVANQGDRVILSLNITAAELGFYSISCMLIESGLTLIRTFVGKVWLPVFSHVANYNAKELKAKYNRVRLIQDIPLYFLVGFLIVYAKSIVGLLYDDRYADVGWILQIQSLNILAVAMTAVGLECLSALGQTKIRMQIIFIQALVLFIGLPLVLLNYGIEHAVWLITMSYFAPLPALYYALNKNGLFSFMTEIRALPIIFISYEFFAYVYGVISG